MANSFHVVHMEKKMREERVCENIRCDLHKHYIPYGVNTFYTGLIVVKIIRCGYSKGNVIISFNLCEECAGNMGYER